MRAHASRANSTALRTISTASSESSSGTRMWRYMGPSVRLVADDSRAFHLAVARRVVHHRVVLRGAVVPERDAVRLPAPAHLELGDVRLAHEVREQARGARIGVLPETHVRRGVEIG